MEHIIYTVPNQLPIIEIPSVGYVALEPFGPHVYERNIQVMNTHHAKLDSDTKVKFRPATTDESMRIVSYMFGDEETFKLKSKVFDSNWLQAGRIVMTQEGVWTNPIGQFDEVTMKKLLTPDRKTNGIYLLSGKTAFAPYESFSTDNQEHDKFLE